MENSPGAAVWISDDGIVFVMSSKQAKDSEGTVSARTRFERHSFSPRRELDDNQNDGTARYTLEKLPVPPDQWPPDPGHIRIHAGQYEKRPFLQQLRPEGA